MATESTEKVKLHSILDDLTDPFLRDIFSDKLHVDSIYSTKANFKQIMREEELADTKNFVSSKHKETLESFRPKWY